jgi:hypothetical protein
MRAIGNLGESFRRDRKGRSRLSKTSCPQGIPETAVRRRINPAAAGLSPLPADLGLKPGDFIPGRIRCHIHPVTSPYGPQQGSSRRRFAAGVTYRIRNAGESHVAAPPERCTIIIQSLPSLPSFQPSVYTNIVQRRHDEQCADPPSSYPESGHHL